MGTEWAQEDDVMTEAQRVMDEMAAEREAAATPWKRSDRAGIVGAMLAVLGVILSLALGFGVGASTRSGDIGESASVSTFTTSGPGFNWFLAVLVLAPFLVAGVVCWATSWVLAEMESRAS